MIDHALVALLLPVLALVIVLAWMFFVICRRTSFNLDLSAFGISIKIDAKHDTTQTQNVEKVAN